MALEFNPGVVLGAAFRNLEVMYAQKIRRALDQRLAPLSRPDARAALARPAGGWVRAVRESLGMSTTDLARRLRVSPAAVSKLEASERAGRVGLDTLSRAADALSCDVVYALVPRGTLDETARRQALHLADRLLQPTRTTMALEAQSVSADADRSAVEDLAAELLVGRGLWREADGA